MGIIYSDRALAWANAVMEKRDALRAELEDVREDLQMRLDDDWRRAIRERDEALARAEKAEAERDQGKAERERNEALAQSNGLLEILDQVAMDFEGACKREIKCQEMLDAANADCACLRGLLREIRTSLTRDAPTLPACWLSRIKLALGEE